MKHPFLPGFLFLALSQIAAAESTLSEIREGLWELIFKSEITPTPTKQTTSATNISQQCLTRETSADPHTFLQNIDCEILNLNQHATQMSWDMRCQQQGIQLTGDGKASYSHESFNGTVNVTMQGERYATLKITTQISGRYLGNCE